VVSEIHEDAWSLEHETIVKSYTEYEISNAFDFLMTIEHFKKV